MEENSGKLNELDDRLEKLIKYQGYFNQEIASLKKEIANLRSVGQEISVADSVSEELPQTTKITTTAAPRVVQNTPKPLAITAQSLPAKSEHQRQINNLEKFIGENLISKIGIVILIIGVTIGAKYTIEHDLISPLTRIVLGYLVGIGLLGLAHKLKPKYLNFSAVLLSGGMAILYFITYAASSYYQLIPSSIAFALMFLLTIFTVFAALKHNRQVIAHIGLVGAYAIPFLLSSHSEKFVLFLSYVAIVNVGILGVSVKRYWKSLFYTSFVITWLLFSGWYQNQYPLGAEFSTALIFATVYFLSLYATFLAYKLIKKEPFSWKVIGLVLVNSFIYYGLGYAIINQNPNYEYYVGLFTIGNAFVHLAVGSMLFRTKSADRNLVNFVAGLALIFITIAIHERFSENWTTILWAGEACLLFWLSRPRNALFYECLSYSLIILSFVSLINVWNIDSNHFYFLDTQLLLPTLFNIVFATGILVSAAYFVIWNINRKFSGKFNSDIARFISIALAAVFIFTIYNTFRSEISRYWANQIMYLCFERFGAADTWWDRDLSHFGFLWQLNFTLFFLTILSLINIRQIRVGLLGIVNLALNLVTVIVFLTVGLFSLSMLNSSYLGNQRGGLTVPTAANIYLRYICFAFLIALFICSYKYLKSEFITKLIAPKWSEMGFDFTAYLSTLVILSSELLNWANFFALHDGNKLGLSILWGMFAAILIGIGIYKKKKHLRIGGIVLFALTLLKLFMFDIADLNTISKTVVFVSLGVLLLIVGFLYTKYKYVIFEGD